MILITGKNGFIASKLIKYMTREIPQEIIIGTTRNKNDKDSVFLDLNNISTFDFSIFSAGDTVIHTAAISSPDNCNKAYEETYEVNVTNTIEFINACIKKNVHILFFSSDTVYGEKYHLFFEDEQLSPLGKYAEMKAEVENTFLHNNLIKTFHLSYVFDKDDKFIQYLKNCYKNSISAEIFNPFDRSVIYMKDLLEAIVAIVKDWNAISSKSINIAGPELLSREILAKYFSNNVKNGLKYKVITPPDKFFEARPRVINMQSKYLEILLGHSPQSIEKAMKLELEGK